MTSQINPSTISTTYPVAGQDNDSQGFRDNFTAIQAALTSAQTEITTLQTNAVRVASFGNDDTFVGITNLLGTTLHDGIYYQLNGKFFNNGTVAASTNINLNNGPIQQVTLGGNAVLTFTNWPSNNQYAVVRIMLVGGISTYVSTLATSGGGTFRTASGWSGGTTPPTVSVANGKIEVIEAWTVNAGATVYLKNIGEY
jgi:hypothetical protein